MTKHKTEGKVNRKQCVICMARCGALTVIYGKSELPNNRGYEMDHVCHLCREQNRNPGERFQFDLRLVRMSKASKYPHMDYASAVEMDAKTFALAGKEGGK